MTSTELWLVRHAQPLVAPGVCYGRLDVPADPAHTQASAQALGAALHAAQGQGGHRTGPLPVWTSPRARAHVLAQALAAHAPAGLLLSHPQRDERLAEMDFGVWEGQRWDDIPRAELEAWTDDFHHHRPGGGENVAEFLHRVRTALEDSAEQAWTMGSPRVVWLTHAGVIRAVQLLLAGVTRPARASDWPADAPAFGQWRVTRLERQG